MPVIKPAMANESSFQLFTRSAFGLEPGCRVGVQLKALANPAVLSRGELAPLDHQYDQLVFVARGATKLAAHATEDREQIVAFHFGGDIVSVPADGLYSYTLTALVGTELLSFPAREFFDYAATEVSTSRALMDRLPRALHRCRDKTVALGQKSALERLAGFLLAMSERVGRLEGNVVILELPMSRRDIGDSIGLTIETVSRQLGALRDAGFIATQGRSRIALLDLEALRKSAGFAPLPTDISPQLGKFDLDQCDAVQARLPEPETGRI